MVDAVAGNRVTAFKERVTSACGMAGGQLD